MSFSGLAILFCFDACLSSLAHCLDDTQQCMPQVFWTKTGRLKVPNQFFKKIGRFFHDAPRTKQVRETQNVGPDPQIGV